MFGKNVPSECSCMNRQRDDSEIFKIDLIILEDNKSIDDDNE